jgi:hypothetical protein
MKIDEVARLIAVEDPRPLAWVVQDTVGVGDPNAARLGCLLDLRTGQRATSDIGLTARRFERLPQRLRHELEPRSPPGAPRRRARRSFSRQW